MEDPQALQVLVESNECLTKLESKDRNGFRPLHRAVAKNATQCTQLLVNTSLFIICIYENIFRFKKEQIFHR